MNSPNDVVVHSDGSVWFTDPAYGIDSDYEGHRAESEIGGCHVYRIDPATGSCDIVADDFDRPNGLAFSLDETQLYIGDSRAKHIRLFDVHDGKLSGGRMFATCTNGTFDGLRLDDTGRVWAAAGDGVHCLHPDGTLLGKLLLPEEASNLVFGGLKRNHLFVSATTSVYALSGQRDRGAARLGDAQRLIERRSHDLAQRARCSRRRRSHAPFPVGEERTRCDPGDRLADVLVEVGERLGRPLRLDADVVLNRPLELVVGEREHPAVGVVDEDDLLGAEQSLGDRQRADRVVGDHAASVADDVPIALAAGRGRRTR